MKTFCDLLKEKGCEENLFAVLGSLKDAAKAITEKIRTADTGKAGSSNVYGEEQLALDVLADKLIQEECGKNPAIGLLASEELPDEIKIGDGEFAVAYDPLDGSSLVDVNLAVGTIYSVYKLGENEGRKSFVGVKGDDMLASMIVVYGPRTTILLALKDADGVCELTLKEGKFVLTNDDVKVGEGKMFSPGNLRAASELPKYVELMDYWMKEQYTLRYSGGMVPDINQILLKGKGIFSYPPYSKHPNGKLRLLFECAPMSLLMEKAGGASSDGKMRILEKTLEELEQRTPIYIGSKDEVNRCLEYLS
jgi:sedoheptulose-bisphosphatase